MTALSISLRRLRKSPAFVVVIVFTLGFGLGVLTAVYSAVHAAFVRPPDLPQADRIAALFQQPPPAALPTLAFSRLELAALHDRQTSFVYLAGMVMFRQPLAVGPEAAPVTGEAVTGHYFRTLAVPPVVGRLLNEADQELAASPVVALSEALWERLFARDERVVGQRVEIGGVPFTIIGVVPRRYRGPLLGAYLPTDIWISLVHATRHRLVAGDNTRPDLSAQTIHAIGRLKEDATIESAAREIAQIGKSLDATALSEPGGAERPQRRVRQWTIAPFASVPLSPLNGPYFRPVVTAVAALAVVLMLVICSNLGTLTLARLMRRSQEIALRRSLGASTRHIVTELLIESAILSALAAVLALVIARILMIPLATRLSVGNGVWIQIDPQLDFSVLAVLMVSGSLAFLAMGVIPVVQATRRSVVLPVTRSRRRGRRIIVAGQTGAAFVFLSITVATAGDLLQRLNMPAGFVLDRLAIARSAAATAQLESTELPRLLAEFRSRLGQIPGVEATAAVSSLPGGFGARAALVSDVAGRQSLALPVIAVSPAALDAIGLPLMSGRSITRTDTRSSPFVAIMSETAADRVFGTRHVLGEQLRLQVPAPNGGRQAPETFVVVGTVKDPIGITDGRSRPEIFIPMAQATLWDLELVARAADPDLVLQPMRAIAQSLGPPLPIVEVTTGGALRLQQSRFLQIGAVVVGIFGAASIVLALAGVVGLVSEFVTVRTREIAVCLALGATRGRVAWIVASEALSAVAAGVVAGLLAAAMFRRAGSTMFLGEMSSFDLSLMVLTVLLMFAGCAACWWPLKRALSITPGVALRQS
jgi:predicted permease